jgi:hypothetical protein
MITFATTVFILTVIYYSMNIAFSSNASVAFPSVRIDRRTSLNSLTDRGISVFASTSGTTSAHTLPRNFQDSQKILKKP